MSASKSARLYAERRAPDLQVTGRSPGARIDMTSMPVHALAMQPPAPLPAILQETMAQPPDAGHTKPWPHGDEEIT